MRRLSGLLFLLGLLIVPQQGQAQLIVQDPLNLIQNTVSAIENVLMVANQVLELTRLGSTALDSTYTDDLSELEGVITDARGLYWDFKQLQVQVNSLFGLQTAPTSTRGLAQRMTQIQQLYWESYVYALKTQSLLSTTLRTVRRLQRITAVISKLVGNMQGNQTIAQLEGSTVETLTRLQVQTAAYERANSIDKLQDPLVQKSMDNITKQIMADWPRRRP